MSYYTLNPTEAEVEPPLCSYCSSALTYDRTLRHMVCPECDAEEEES